MKLQYDTISNLFNQMYIATSTDWLYSTKLFQSDFVWISTSRKLTKTSNLFAFGEFYSQVLYWPNLLTVQFQQRKNIELAKYGSGVRWCFFNTCFWHTARCKHGSLNIQIYGDLQICAKFTNSNLQLQIWEANVFNTS